MNAVLNRALSHVTMPVLTAAVTVASAAGVLAGPSAAAITGGILLGCVLPGLALTELLFRHRTLSAVERAVLAPALSLATLIVCGLLLYVAGFRLDRTSWTLGAAGVTLLVLALTAVPQRVWQGEEDEYYDVYVDPGDERLAAQRVPAGAPDEAATELIPVVRDGDAPPPRPAVRALPGPFAPWSPAQRIRAGQVMRQLLPMIMVVAILAGAGYLSFVSSRASYDVVVTTLSAAPPGPADADGNRVVQVTASGLVTGHGPYNLVVTGPAGAPVLERQIAVDADGTWTAPLTVPAEDRLTVGLFRSGDAIAYRTLLIAAQD